MRSTVRIGIMPRIFGVALSGLVLVVGVLSWLTLGYINRDIETNANKRLDLAMSLERSLIDQHLSAMADRAVALSNTTEVRQALQQGGATGLHEYLRTFQPPKSTHILTVVDAAGRVVARANSKEAGQPFTANGLVEQAVRTGSTVWAAEVIPQSEWAPEGDQIRQQVVMEVKQTDGAEAPAAKELTDALSLVAAAPVRDPSGKVVGAVVAAEILNQNYALVDEVQQRTGGQVTATIALDNVRVATNVRTLGADHKPTDERAIGTMYAVQVMDALRSGKEYRGSALVGGWQQQRTVYVPLTDHAGKVIAGPFVGIPEAELLQLKQDVAGILIPVVLGGVLTAGALAFFFARSVSRRVQRLAGAAAQIARGDLTVEAMPVTTNDELGDMALAFNEMVRNLRQLVRQISLDSQSVASSAEQLSAATEQVALSAQDAALAVGKVAEGTSSQSGAVQESTRTVSELRVAITQVAAGAQEQADQAQQTATFINEMAALIDDVAHRATEVSHSSQRAAATARKGSQVVGRSIDGMGRVHDAVLQSAERIKALGKLSAEIGEITQVIDAIAGQTNLLALNAAIEAARAGAHGKGFAVVADEVRKLAERAAQSAEKIAGLSQEIQEGTAHAVEAMERGTVEVQEGSRLAGDAGNALHEIIATVEQTTRDVEEITEAAERLAANSSKVVTSIASVAAVAQESSAATEEMAAGTDEATRSVQAIAAAAAANATAAEEVAAQIEEVNASTEEMADAAQRLARIAQDLQAQVSRFKVGA